MKPIIQNSELLDTLTNRYATKLFDPERRISENDWNTLSEALRLSPSSYGLQPWKFIVVQNSDVRKKLRAASWNQAQVEDCSHFVVFTTLRNVDEAYVRKFIDSTAQVRGISPESLKGYYDMMVSKIANNPSFDHLEWTRRQSYIAMGFLGLSAALLWIDTCMLEWIDPAAYDEILGLNSSSYATVAAVALGYRSEGDGYANAAKSRFSSSEIIEVIQ